MVKRLYIKYIRNIYRWIVPLKTRRKIEFILFGVSKPKLRRKIIRYLESKLENKITSEELEVLSFLISNPLQVFPYEFTREYNAESVKVEYDRHFDLNYVLYVDKKLFFKRNWSEERIKTIFSNQLIEQHPKSPHRYLGHGFDVEENSVVVDIGVADGNFALSIIEKVKKVYLFEPNEKWIEALEATFSPWRDKVIIVNKWVSDIDDEPFITLDTYFRETKLDFIKIDVDGFEWKLINGSRRIISGGKNLKIALCTYHKQDDHVVFSEFFKERGFDISYSNGYMIFPWGKQKAPYLRRGMIRATKRNG
jgi:hypothetical protein